MFLAWRKSAADDSHYLSVSVVNLACTVQYVFLLLLEINKQLLDSRLSIKHYVSKKRGSLYQARMASVSQDEIQDTSRVWDTNSETKYKHAVDWLAKSWLKLRNMAESKQKASQNCMSFGLATTSRYYHSRLSLVFQGHWQGECTGLEEAVR